MTKKKTFSVVVVGWMAMTSLTHASSILSFSQDKRLVASISSESMNRIAAVNDRISQIFGDEGTFVTQADENTGQIFIKPTRENGKRPLSLTLITEKGLTQDLTLKPTNKGPETLLLKTMGDNTTTYSMQDPPQGEDFHDDHEGMLFSSRAILHCLKKTILQRGEIPNNNSLQRKAPPGYALYHQGSYLSGAFVGMSFQVTNTTSTDLEVDERAFYREGDLALSLKKRVLKPDEATFLYVVRR